MIIYEYEYEGKKYKYRTHQRDNFSPVPETLELGFGKYPSKAYKINNSLQKGDLQSSTNINFFILIWGWLILAVILIIYFICSVIKAVIDFEISIFSLLIIISLFTIAIMNGIKKQKNGKSRDEMIENAMLNNHTVSAYLTKSRYRMWRK